MADTMADTEMNRATYGTGSLYQRRSDWRWIGTLEGGYTASGGRRRVSVTGAGCVDECPPRCHHRKAMERKMRDKRAELEANGRKQVKRTTSVASWSKTWLETIQTQVRPSAYETDRAAVRTIVAAIGEVKLSDLTPGDVRKVRRQVTSAGKSSSTALRYHGSLIRMLKAATLEGYSVPSNVLLVKNPKAAVNDREAVPLEHSIAALGHIATMEDGSRWSTTFLQGHRQAESLGLTWPYIDLDAETLTIAWQLKSLRYIDQKRPELGFLVPDGYEAKHLVGATHLVRPKSTAGWRVQPLVPWAANVLRAWREVAPENPHGLVWPGRVLKGRTWPRNPASDRDQWHDIQKTVGIHHPSRRDKDGDPAPYHVHEIRHGTATLLLALGVTESVRVAIMGHSSIASTRAYEHVDLSLAREALGKVAQRLELL